MPFWKKKISKPIPKQQKPEHLTEVAAERDERSEERGADLNQFIKPGPAFSNHLQQLVSELELYG